MNLVKVQQSSMELARRFDGIGRHALNRGFSDRFVVGRCVSERPVIHGNGAISQCGNAVISGEGYADTDGTPWKAYYCPACARDLDETAG